jgi:hypothetical protein
LKKKGRKIIGYLDHLDHSFDGRQLRDEETINMLTRRSGLFSCKYGYKPKKGIG